MSIQFDFTDQIVLVTGASGSFGTATVEQFHDAGATVCMSARHPPEDDEAAALLDADRVHFYDADFTDETAVQQVFDSVIDDHGRLDTLCTLIGAWRGGTPSTRPASTSLASSWTSISRRCFSPGSTLFPIYANPTGIS